MNERLRFLRYYKKQHFDKHFDGSFRRSGETSLLTILLYLNEDYSGGRTTFYDDTSGEELANEPNTGLILIHDHAILHAGTPVISGCKYVIRSDIMYECGV